MSSLLSDPSSAIPVNHKLVSRETWPQWFTLYRHHARFRGIWPYVNPDGPDSIHVSLEAPRVPTIERYIRQENARRQEQYNKEFDAWELRATNQREPEPQTPAVAVKRDVEAKYESDRKDFAGRAAEWSAIAGRYVTLWNWVTGSVGETILTSVLSELDLLQPEVNPSIQVIVRKLKERLAPSRQSIIDSARRRYIKALDQARHGSINPETWYRQWYDAYVRAKAEGIPEIDGQTAVQDFVLAVGRRLAPNWATTQMDKLASREARGKPPATLDEYSKLFAVKLQQYASMREEDYPRSSFGVHATAAPREQHKCPCLARSDHKHKWLPDDCDALMYAVYGRATSRRTPEPHVCKSIRERFNSDAWSELRTKLESEHGKPKPTLGGLPRNANITA